MHCLSEQIMRKGGGYRCACLTWKSSSKEAAVGNDFGSLASCRASDTSIVAFCTALLFRILIKMSLADYTAS